MKEIAWINTGRAICMICVFVLHTESRFGIDTFAYSFFFMPFFLTFFFFVSGYLMLYNETIDYSKKLKSIVGKMLWPYFVFTTIIWIPKMLKHGQEISVGDYLLDVFGGTASWFIAALIVAELLILAFVKIFHKTFSFYYIFVGGGVFVLAQYLIQWNPNPFPCYYQLGLVNLIFLFLGAAYKRLEKWIEPRLSIYSLLLLSIVYFSILLLDLDMNGVEHVSDTIQWRMVLLDFFENVLGIVWILNLCLLLPSIPVLSYIGKNSIVFYFLSGAVPSVVGLVFNKIYPCHSYGMMLFVTLVSLLAVFPITYLLKNYFPLVINLFYKK